VRTEIIFEDKDLLVCYKPAGLATQSARPGQMDMVSELRNYLAKTGGKNPYIGMVHRLDQPVEGLLVFGKTKQATAELTKQLTGNTLNKTYLAVVCGKPFDKAGNFVDYMKKDTSRAEITTKEDKDGKEARLSYRCLETVEVEGKELSLMEIFIETGRFHQIRAQMAHHDLPLIGDVKYGLESSSDESVREDAKKFTRKLGVNTVALCAKSLTVFDSKNRKSMEFSCQPKNKVFTYFALGK